MSDEISDEMSIEDAIRFKHELNKSITYSGYNAKQLREMENLTKEQYTELNEHLTLINKAWWVFPNYFWVICIVAAGFCAFYFSKWSIRIACVMAIIYCVAQIWYRAGVSYGYVRGYESGHQEGVRKALGITDDDRSDIRERAMEMEIDERLIKKLDEPA